MKHKMMLCLASVLALAAIYPVAAAEVTLTPIGTPDWKPVDLHLFSAPIGSGASGYAEFYATLAAILPEPNHVSDPVFGILPGTPHLGPYDQEIGSGVSGLGFAEKTIFSGREFSNGLGIHLAFMLVPTAGSPTGSSADFSSGPIIPNNLIPIHSIASTYRDGVLFSTPGEFDTKLPTGVEGYSHIPNFYADNLDFALTTGGVVGSYEYRLELTDAAGEGWNIVAPFQVVPEPGSLVLLGIGVIGLAAYGRIGRRRL
jgi:hypothetical protein